MVTNVTSFSRSGLADFVIQRVTAVILALYTLCVVGFFLTAPELTHASLTAYFGGSLMKAFSTMAVLATVSYTHLTLPTIYSV